MGCRAGLDPWDVDARSPNEVWLKIEAWDEQVQMQWEMTRAICFNVAKFGNSDPKKFPKTPQRFWPFSWDGDAVSANPKTIIEQHAKMVARRKMLEDKMKKG
jgi:hypothetical protein